MSKQEATRLADALCSEPVNSIDAAQRRGHLGSPSEWRNACRLFRARCSPEDASRMARLRAYIEDGLLEVVRPTAPSDQSERIAALEAALGKIDAIRNSIIGAQKVNWSEHIYPLVAALEGAGYHGQEYEVARENLGTLLARIAALENSLAERDRVIEQARVALRHGIKTINHLGGAVECMPLHDALRKIEEGHK